MVIVMLRAEYELYVALIWIKSR